MEAQGAPLVLRRFEELPPLVPVFAARTGRIELVACIHVAAGVGVGVAQILRR